jgi:hypothetical protein
VPYDGFIKKNWPKRLTKDFILATSSANILNHPY